MNIPFHLSHFPSKSFYLLSAFTLFGHCGFLAVYIPPVENLLYRDINRPETQIVPRHPEYLTLVQNALQKL